jgi:hypothetical protein
MIIYQRITTRNYRTDSIEPYLILQTEPGQDVEYMTFAEAQQFLEKLARLLPTGPPPK